MNPLIIYFSLFFCVVTLEGSEAYSLPDLEGYRNHAYHLKHQTNDDPIYKQLKILKPTGKPLERADIVSQLKSFFKSRGWKVDNDREGYIAFSFNLYEENDQYGYTHHTGDLEAWVSESGDLIAMHQYQWRNSRFHPSTVRRINRIKEKIRLVSTELGFDFHKTSVSDWPNFYSNENLIEYVTYGLQLPKDRPKVHYSDHSKGKMLIRLLGYRTDLHAISAVNNFRVTSKSNIIRSKNLVVLFQPRDKTLNGHIESMVSKLQLDKITGETQADWNARIQNQTIEEQPIQPPRD